MNKSTEICSQNAIPNCAPAGGRINPSPRILRADAGISIREFGARTRMDFRDGRDRWRRIRRGGSSGQQLPPPHQRAQHAGVLRRSAGQDATFREPTPHLAPLISVNCWPENSGIMKPQTATGYALRSERGSRWSLPDNQCPWLGQFKARGQMAGHAVRPKSHTEGSIAIVACLRTSRSQASWQSPGWIQEVQRLAPANHAAVWAVMDR